ncbi:MAG: Cfr10I/Bse634I family restriction endonuclease [Crocosphaera sp.]|uniref:Deoxyribose-phosphate aldolase n=3 Tax=Crocosphaera watsonii TaxID=263511 RepID=T2JUX7_CROWT|nr:MULTISPECIES: Cfr10I/Bse634I family restriction endonuclease [Crocosphaera]EHJ11134.1 deoxyribose-phosphate aldolase [Crocosphaera watsonii WH 0003]MCH2244119.1 Cfr10I/Bse634I family restriction endonuclease [Crocosphaera sp.]NQZ64938.1 Cfr10I/Bse634I family restriction endonuclease [Crocosphaera sp.]CCQ54389.1 deoxyribose-phosphate aldolase [Crocosphaera watsonii WH 0005]CCQ68427.1 deoxyribose-phosphate aldolase [Crocosphaera watsonii WH 0402]
MNHELWFTPRKNKIQINGTIIYKDLSEKIIEKLNDNLSVSEIIRWIREKTQYHFREEYGYDPQVGSLNNSAGRWNELIATTILSKIILNVNQQLENSFYVVTFQLPKSRLKNKNNHQLSSQILNLFHPSSFNKGQLLEQISQFKDQIFMPSPDYIIAVIPQKFIPSIQPLLQHQAENPDNLEIYQFLESKLKPNNIKAIISLKTSNRSDRRYQPLFEAAMLKAISYTLHQNWKYYMVSSELSSADNTIFETAIAPHGLVLGKNLKLVDGTYNFTQKEDLLKFVKEAIND